MIYLLDTNVVIGYLRGNALIRARFQAHYADTALPVMALSELLHGAAKSRNPAAETAKVVAFAGTVPIVPFEAGDAPAYAEIRSDLEARGLMIGHPDLIIAAIAKARNLTVVTHNTAHFSRAQGLKIVDWEIP